MTTKTTAGAVRAAEKIMEHCAHRPFMPNQFTLEEIIDRETGLAELVEAAERVLTGITCQCNADANSNRHDLYCVACQLQAALAKAGK